jgi:hypothetical protein
MHRALALALVVCAAACTQQEGTASAFQAPSDKAALEVVKSFLDAARARDVEGVRRRLCDATPGAGERTAQALSGPLAIDGWEVVRVEPAWAGAEPYFRVDVTLKRGDNSELRALSVRAREACVDRLLGEPVDPARGPDPGEIEL